MIAYHFFFDLSFFTGPLFLLARLTAMTFILLTGISTALLFNQLVSMKIGYQKILTVLIKRAGHIFIWALIITGITYILFPREFIYFGILHFISVSLLLIIPFLFIKNRLLLFALGLIFIYLGQVTKNSIAQAPPSLDYFPIFPWFGLVVLGLAVGRDYLRWRPLLIPIGYQPNRFFTFTSLLGRHSLSIYLAHQPILIIFLTLYRQLSH